MENQNECQRTIKMHRNNGKYIGLLLLILLLPVLEIFSEQVFNIFLLCVGLFLAGCVIYFFLVGLLWMLVFWGYSSILTTPKKQNQQTTNT